MKHLIPFWSMIFLSTHLFGVGENFTAADLELLRETKFNSVNGVQQALMKPKVRLELADENGNTPFAIAAYTFINNPSKRKDAGVILKLLLQKNAQPQKIYKKNKQKIELKNKDLDQIIKENTPKGTK